MALPSSYLNGTKNLRGIFAAMQKASVPETFTYEFLKQLGFSSSSARPIIPVMKALGLLDTGGRPTQRYREYKDPALAGAVLAQAMRSAYADVFAIDTEAHRRSQKDLTGIFSRLSDKGESPVQKMALTFKGLADMADWSLDGETIPLVDDGPETPDTPSAAPFPPMPTHATGGMLSLRHDIHIHLPLSTDVAVYDAIFMRLSRNLL